MCARTTSICRRDSRARTGPALCALLICVAAMGSAGRAFAHHSFASVFDRERPVALSGTVSRVEWMNPHTWFYIVVENADGVAEQWALELGSPNNLIRHGWTRHTLALGQSVKVTGYRARDGSFTAAVREVTLASGEPLSGAQHDAK
jgi:hypothetical protein